MTAVSALVLLFYIAAVGFVVAALFHRIPSGESSPWRWWRAVGLRRGFTPTGVRLIQIAALLWLAGVTIRIVGSLVRGAS
jgi:hypothetical protein